MGPLILRRDFPRRRWGSLFEDNDWLDELEDLEEPQGKKSKR